MSKKLDRKKFQLDVIEFPDISEITTFEELKSTYEGFIQEVEQKINEHSFMYGPSSIETSIEDSGHIAPGEVEIFRIESDSEFEKRKRCGLTEEQQTAIDTLLQEIEKDPSVRIKNLVDYIRENTNANEYEDDEETDESKFERLKKMSAERADSDRWVKKFG
jgi:hypothetical protein